MLNDLIPFVIWVDLVIALFSVPLFAIGLAHLFRALRQAALSNELESDLRIASITWGLLIFALLSSSVLSLLNP